MSKHAFTVLRRKLLSAATILVLLPYSFCSYAITSEASAIDESKDSQMEASFLKRQVDQNMSISRAIRSIASHYPQNVVPLVDLALDTYPDKYREIIFAAISAQPASTEEIVQLAIEKEVSSCPNIVELAISAEPTYVDFVVKAASLSTPEELDEIVRVAVLTQPDSADTIVQTLSQEHPNKLVDIMTTALNTVPFVGEYVVDALLAVFPNQAEEVVETAVRESSQREHVARILSTAMHAGVPNEKLKEYALSAGFSEAEFQDAINN